MASSRSNRERGFSLQSLASTRIPFRLPSPQVPRRGAGGAAKAPPDSPTTGTPEETRLFLGFGVLLLLAFGILLRLAGQAAGALAPADETTTAEQFAVVSEIGVRSDALAQSTKNLLQFGHAQVADDPTALLRVVTGDDLVIGGNGFFMDRPNLGQRGKTEVYLGSQCFQGMYCQNSFLSAVNLTTELTTSIKLM